MVCRVRARLRHWECIQRFWTFGCHVKALFTNLFSTLRLVQAIAGHFKHNLCHLHLTHPNLTDESLRAAVNQAPRHSQLGFEESTRLSPKFQEFIGILQDLTTVICMERDLQRFGERISWRWCLCLLRLLVFEDIDAIFGKDREKLLTDSVLTFSGDAFFKITDDYSIFFHSSAAKWLLSTIFLLHLLTIYNAIQDFQYHFSPQASWTP